MEEKNPIGRPSKYKPEYCEQLIEHMSKGYSYETFSAVVNVSRDTIYQWEKDHEEFSYAKRQAFEKSQIFWEKIGIDNIVNTSESFGEGQSISKTLNASAWIFNMKNRFKWRDKHEDENDSININITLADKISKARSRVSK